MRFFAIGRTLAKPATTVSNRVVQSLARSGGLVVVATGPDRIGVVHDVTRVIMESGGSVGESNSMQLGGLFTLAMQVGVPEGHAALPSADGLRSELSSLLGNTFTISVAQEKTVQMPALFSARFDVSLADDKGVLNKVSNVFAAKGLNIASLTTTQELAPITSTPLFSMKGTVVSTQAIDAEAIHKELNKLAVASGVEYEFTSEGKKAQA